MTTVIEDAFYRFLESVVKDLQSEKLKHSATLKFYPTFEKDILDRILSKVESGKELQALVEISQPAIASEVRNGPQISDSELS